MGAPDSGSEIRGCDLIELWREVKHAGRKDSVESMLTVVTTLKQQQRNVLAYLTAACQAALSEEPAPSLLPETEGAGWDQAAL
jgi:hypothetical protein